MRVATSLLICWKIRYPFKNEQPITDTLTVSVTDENGEPIENATVTLTGGD